jgi:hypothetical protein
MMRFTALSFKLEVVRTAGREGSAKNAEQLLTEQPPTDRFRPRALARVHSRKPAQTPAAAAK